MTDALSVARGYGSTFIYDNYIVFCGGSILSTTSITDVCDVLDMTSDTLNQEMGDSIKYPIEDFSFKMIIDGRTIYSIGGYFSTNLIRKGFIYNTNTPKPTGNPTDNPTGIPIAIPTNSPTNNPTSKKTNNPTGNPTSAPTTSPTSNPAADSTPNYGVSLSTTVSTDSIDNNQDPIEDESSDDHDNLKNKNTSTNDTILLGVGLALGLIVGIICLVLFINYKYKLFSCGCYCKINDHQANVTSEKVLVDIQSPTTTNDNLPADAALAAEGEEGNQAV